MRVLGPGCLDTGAAQLVRYDHSWTPTVGLQQPAKKSHGCESIALWLDRNVNDEHRSDRLRAKDNVGRRRS